jgi:chromate transport protein ChrA
MTGMDVLTTFRMHKRRFLWLAIFAYLCYVVLVVKDPKTLVLLIGVGVLIVFVVSPSKRGPKPKRRKFRPPPPRKKTKKYLDFN